MAIKLKYYSALLFTASISLAGCQTTEIVPPKTTPQDKIIRTMQADSDLDSDGVLDAIDECPATPLNVVIDERGCPFTGIGTGLKMEYRAFFPKNSSEILSKYQIELDKIAIKMQEYNTATMRIEGSISEYEIDNGSSIAKNRALMVKNYLILKHGIEPNRLRTFNCDARAPIAPSDTEEGRSFNRRVYGIVTEPEDEIAYQQPNDSKPGPCIEF